MGNGEPNLRMKEMNCDTFPDYTPGEPSRDRFNGNRRRVVGKGDNGNGGKGNRGRDRNGKRTGKGRKDNDNLGGGVGKNGDATVEPATTDEGVWRKKGKKGWSGRFGRGIFCLWDFHVTEKICIKFRSL